MRRFDELYVSDEAYFGHEPSRVLKAYYRLIPERGRVLDIGVGQGRNALFLARRGAFVVGIDSSSVGVEATRRAAEADGLDLELRRGDIMEFEAGAESFDAVLALGIIPLLPRDDVDTLFRRVDRWLKPGGHVFVTAYLTLDKRYRESILSWERLGRNTFRKHDRIRTFLEPGEAPELLPDYEVIHHAEELGPAHSHGDGPVERHFLAHLVARKPPRAE